jgi:putative ABC transport system ATP-binding protein
LSVYKGEFLCILGTSGGGKTTLLNVMGTIDKPTKG